ncbi:MAG: Glycogen synthase GlgA [Parcubacteria group bacterium GW2011_GWA2_45_30]|nr:MAG: Glycogen synthase GlgA [Parcubacteria group bacterium GW2011_GWA2_45_30]
MRFANDLIKFLGKKPPLRILFVTSEEAPFAKVGGLGEIMFSLPRALNKLGHDARVMIPRYGTIERSLPPFNMEYEGLDVPTAPEQSGTRLICNVLRCDSTDDPHSPTITYFLENKEYYELRSNIYGYKDDAVRFALLTRGCLEFLNHGSDWLPDILVATDWMTGFLPNFLATDYREYKKIRKIASVFSIHNLNSQGPQGDHRFIPESELDNGYGSIPDFFDLRMENINAMRRGILYADVINTVSQKYAQEIMTEEFGEGLDGILRERRDRIFGILNGIDYETNNPAADNYLAANFSVKNLERRGENKIYLQKHFGLPQGQQIFLSGIVSRLTKQKGFSLFPPVIESFLKETRSQIIIMGTGEIEIMTYFQDLEKKFPDQVRAQLQFDGVLPHLIFAGADVVLVPSNFEPSGLTQMEAMRYGAIPVARRVGGLADTIEDFNPETQEGTGFLFDEFNPMAFLIALIRSFVNWKHHASWRKLQCSAMEKDFSWERSAKEYERLFYLAADFHARNGIKPHYIPPDTPHHLTRGLKPGL